MHILGIDFKNILYYKSKNVKKGINQVILQKKQMQILKISKSHIFGKCPKFLAQNKEA